jgi:RNA polymerase sigma-70 factor (ECF subfamily)
MLSTDQLDDRARLGAAPAEVVPSFDDVYARCFAFVWRSVRRLGVPDEAAEDVAQEIFVIVHRRLPTYAGRGSIEAWLFGVVRGVVANWRRSARRTSARITALAEAAEPPSERHPQALAEKAEAVRILYRLLAELDDERREVFVLAELEQMPVPDIARALGSNLNTVYSRLRAARADFKAAVGRHQAEQRRRSP